MFGSNVDALYASAFQKKCFVILGDADFLCVEGQYFHEIGVHEMKKKSKWSQL